MKRALCLSLLLVAAVARAEPPMGEYSVTVDGDGALRVPTSGSTGDCRTVRGIEVCMVTAIGTTVLGSLAELDPNAPPGDDGEIELDGPVTSGELPLELDVGFLSGSTRKPKAAMAFSISDGVVTDNDLTFDAIGAAGLRCKLDRDDPDALACSGAVNIRILSAEDPPQVVGSTTIPIVSRIALTDAPFDLELDLSTDADGIVTGTADAVFAAGTLPRVVVGKYDARSDTATLKIVGIDAGLGNRMVLKRGSFAGGSVSGGRLIYKIAGQKGAVDLD